MAGFALVDHPAAKAPARHGQVVRRARGPPLIGKLYSRMPHKICVVQVSWRASLVVLMADGPDHEDAPPGVKRVLTRHESLRGLRQRTPQKHVDCEVAPHP